MKSILIFVIFITVTLKYTKQYKDSKTTLRVQDRVAILKYQIASEIKKERDKIRDHEKLKPINNHDFSADYEYIDKQDEPITPIMDYDERKKAHRFKMRELKTTKRELQGHTKKHVNKNKREGKRKRRIKQPKALHRSESTENDRSVQSNSKDTRSEHIFDNILKIVNKKHTFEPITSLITVNQDAISQLKSKVGRNADDPHQHTPKKKPKVSKVTDNAFYRRQLILSVEDTNNLKREYVHCQDLISPVLKAQKSNLTVTKRLTVKNHVVLRIGTTMHLKCSRLIQLISEDTSDDTREDIYSILYQISNIQIRLFQWDVAALQLLFNVLNKEHIKRHTFKTIKQGVKKTLASWHLDFTNTTNLLKQARLFRPPCVRMFGYGGSTKTSKGLRISKPETTKCSQENLELCDD